MNRRNFIGSLATTGVGSVSAFAQATQSHSPSLTLTKTPLVIMAPRSDGAEAVWAVNELCKGEVHWECDDGSKGVTANDGFGFVPQSHEILRIRIEGLTLGKKYRARALTTAARDGRQETSPWKWFRTLDPRANASRFTVWNDTHINNETIRKLHEVTPPADFLLWNGDTCNDWKSPDLLIPTLLHPGGCDISDGRPLLLAWGNHDVRGAHAFEMPKMVATPSGRPYYALRTGPLAVICLHTGEDKPDDHPSFNGRVAFDKLRREQADWLTDTVGRPEFRDAPYRIVFCHIPLRWTNEVAPDYANGGFDHFSLRSRVAWHRSLVDWKAQLVISGHTHRHAWLPPNEQFPYGQVTGGGPQPNSATWMDGQANENEFNLKVRTLDGTVRHQIKLRPLA